jgi:hypothetical protein
MVPGKMRSAPEYAWNVEPTHMEPTCSGIDWSPGAGRTITKSATTGGLSGASFV